MPTGRPRKATATSSFGVSRRESHDASAFYDRFPLPAISPDDAVTAPKLVDELIVGDSRSMTEVLDNSVALVVTSPPYYAGKAYEEDVGNGVVPASYRDYLRMLSDVFEECVRVLEPGGRIAVNVANLGRRPYRSLSADVIGILQDELGLLLRGEIIWVKAQGASGSCAWGSFQQPANPVLRDLSERIIVASKGRFDRAVPRRERAREGLPSVATITRDEFMDSTTDVWEFAAESASRIGHPAPYPVELPARLIELYTYEGDVVLDPFVGSGSTAVAAARSGRHYLGYDTDAAYVEAARERVAALRAEMGEAPRSADDDSRSASLTAAFADGTKAHDVARELLNGAGFTDLAEGVKLPSGIDVTFTATDAHGRRCHIELAGGFSSARPGLRRTDILWRTIAKASVIHAASAGDPARQPRVIVLTTDLPAARSPAAKALCEVVGHDRPIEAVVDLLDADVEHTLALLASSIRTT